MLLILAAIGQSPSTANQISLQCDLSSMLEPPGSTPRLLTINTERGKIFFTPDPGNPSFEDYCPTCQVSVDPERIAAVDSAPIFGPYRLDIDRISGSAREKMGDDITFYRCRRVPVPHALEPTPKF